ncbi:MAG: hypothetical protein ACFFEK_17035, partial [Candidatus Thorarchaeota archaeon]
GIKLSEEYAKSSDIERLEERIDNLRFVVICLTTLVLLLFIDAIFQLTPQLLLLPSLAVVGLIILIFILSNSCTRANGEPTGT